MLCACVHVCTREHVCVRARACDEREYSRPEAETCNMAPAQRQRECHGHYTHVLASTSVSVVFAVSFIIRVILATSTKRLVGLPDQFAGGFSEVSTDSSSSESVFSTRRPV